MSVIEPRKRPRELGAVQANSIRIRIGTLFAERVPQLSLGRIHVALGVLAE
jgi:hypothetical protein